MLAGDGKDDPFGDVDRVVADTLKVLGHHDKVDGLFAEGAVLADELNKLLFDADKKVVYLVVHVNDLAGQIEVFFDKGVNAGRNHADGGAGHVADGIHDGRGLDVAEQQGQFGMKGVTHNG